MSFLGGYRPTRLGFGPSSEALMTPRDAYDMNMFIHEAYGPRIDAGTEFFAVVPMDANGRVLRSVVVAEGTEGEVVITLQDLFKVLQDAGPNATRFFMAHNHPSGQSSPSKDDVLMTQTVMRALLTHANGRWKLDDHIVTTADKIHYGSIREVYGQEWKLDRQLRVELGIEKPPAARKPPSRRRPAV